MAVDMANAKDEACECAEDTPEPCGTSVFTDDIIIEAAGDDELSGGGVQGCRQADSFLGTCLFKRWSHVFSLLSANRLGT